MEGFEFDSMKDEENRDKHGFGLAAAMLLFDGPFIEEEDRRRNYGETRFIAMGPLSRSDERIYVAVYTWRNGKRRVISFRKANERETGRYRHSHSRDG